MSISAIFIRLPVMTTLVMTGILAFGILGFHQLPVSDLPNVDYPTINVTANLPGANPETMAAAVATPLERQFSTIAGVDSMTSTSNLGGTQITLNFVLSRNIDAAAQDVQSAITAALRQLPPGMPTPPTYQKSNPADTPILYLALHSDSLPLSTVDEYGETIMAQRISMITGVSQVQVYGAQKYAVRAQVDPDLLAARGIGIDEVEHALQQGNVDLPTGTLNGDRRAATIQANGQLLDASAFRPLVVAYRNGAPVRLDQLGSVIDSVQNNRTASWFNDSRAVVLAIQRQPGTNTVQIVDDVQALLPTLRARLPPALQLDILFDRSQGIRSSVRDVEHTLLITAVLVVLVIFVFLRRVTATIIPALSLPMSVIGTFALMYVLGYNLDNLSLMSLTLATGFVVDDAIVMLENIVRRMEGGEDAAVATREGARQIGFTVVSMTLSLAAVFIPILFMGGLLGRLFREFAVTITIAILVSGFISLTLTPMLCSLFLRHAPERHGRLYRISERGFELMLGLYERTLRIALRWRFAVLLSLFASFAATAWLYLQVPKGFVPSEDTGQILGSTQADLDVSFDDMSRHQQAVAAIVRKDPDVAAFMSVAAAGGATPQLNQGIVFIRLRDLPERTSSPEQVIDRLRKATVGVPGIRTVFQNPPPIRLPGRIARGQYQYTLQATDTEQLFRSAADIEAEIRKIADVVDVTNDVQNDSPRVLIDIDRDKAASLGITAGQIESALASAYGSNQVGTIYTDTNEYWVMLEVAPQFQSDPAALSRLYVRPDAAGASPALVPLGAFATIRRGTGPLSVSHQGQLPAATISFNLVTGAPLGPVVDRINALGAKLPTGVIGSFQGTALVFQSSLSGLGVLLAIAVGVIYLVLGILYESFIHPLTILSGLPAAGIGALVTLWVCGVDLNIYAFVGVIMLIGIVKKNAIMMIDFALAIQAEQGVPPEEAIYRGCIVRFRPIMMTTMAALMGTIPLAIGIGAPSASRHSLGLVVVGGLVFSQLITLYMTPVVYIYMERFSQALRRLAPGRKPAPATV
jgi:HAE1 family hydrophobic/amphiphilic exporter-1